MISESELVKLLQNLESDRVERTISLKATDKFCEAICAFANDLPNHRQPGYLLVGVDDQGHPSEQRITDQVLQNLAATRSDGNIQPLPALTVQKYTVSGLEIAVVEVFPSDLPPVRYKGRVWIRVGPRRAMASEGEERILSERRVSLARTFDARSCPECKLEDLTWDLFLVTYRPNAIAAEILQENNRDLREQLAALRFYDLKRDCATFAGALLFGKNPLQWLPGAYIQFAQFQGSGMTGEVQRERTFSGDLLTMLRELDAFLPQQISCRPVSFSSLREKIVQEYPLSALREFLMNAVMHRSYESTAPIRFYWFEDHLEIQNPGGLYGEATPENFPRQNAYRNPVIAEAMKALGYVNKYGRGVLRAQEFLAKNGNPPATFDFASSYFLTTVRR